ncbi:6467_t:CDS:1, partial [Scutellospora calospora]
RQPLPKHNPHLDRDEFTVNTNSSRSSFEAAGEHRAQQQQYQDQVQMSQPYSQPYVQQQSLPVYNPQLSHTPMSGVSSQHASPIITPTGMVMDPQPIPTGPQGPGIGFPQPQHFPPQG